MAKRTYIPESAACVQWEMLLVDALDGVLTPQDEAVFTAHQANCKACAALFEQARQGREWLEFLSRDPEVPAGLVDRILASTGPGVRAAHPVMAGAGVMALPGAIPAWQRPGFMGLVRRWAEPRLVMTAAMAFFSIALTLNLAGVRLSRIRLSDLRPTAVRSFMERRLNMASVPIIRYYDHLHLVYEVQSQMQELRGDDQDGPQQNQSQPSGSSELRPSELRPGELKPGGSKNNAGGLREEKPSRRDIPAQAHADSFGRFVDAAFPGNWQAHTTANRRTRVQNRAFRWLRNPTVSKASERNRLWTA